MLTLQQVLEENERRNLAMAERNTPPNPVDASAPVDILRCADDFEYWAARCVTIRDKRSGAYIPFVLNGAQRRVLATLESMRNAGRPIRLIMLKARQWGGSTLIQIYMAWIQMIHRRNWHSVICAHVKDAARTIRGMYSMLLDSYPEALADPDAGRYRLASFEGAQNVRVITGRDCRVAIASAESQDSVRGSDIAMAHLSEVAFWKATAAHDPEDFLRAVCGSVPLVPLSLVAIESTANGVGNFFHTEWLRAEQGLSDKAAVFVPWYEIDIYRLTVNDPEAFWNSLTPYELDLWHTHGCTLEQINWYRNKLAEYPKPELMQAEFPTTPREAFISSDANVFSNEHIERMRRDCLPPIAVGEVANRRFVTDRHGQCRVWQMPRPDTPYIVTVDVGGRSAKSDWSVIAVTKICNPDAPATLCPEIVAQWRGHIDHDILADKAVDIARFYNDALLVIESNTLETADESSSSSSVLIRVSRDYDNLYYRSTRVPGYAGINSNSPGFHTNRNTKALCINALIAAVRDGAYTERDDKACNELSTYCRLDTGAYQARRGCHDDILMTRAITLFIISQLADDPADPLGLYNRLNPADSPRPVLSSSSSLW